MKKIGLQLYTIKEEAEKDLLGTIEKVAKMGYDGVEFAGFHGVSADDVRKTLDENNIKAVGIHLDVEKLKTILDEQMAYAKIIGCNTIICPGVFGEDTKNEEFFHLIAKFFNTVGEKCKANGFRFLYHVHGHEFENFNGITGMDIIFQETNEQLVFFEVDTHWLEWAGIDSVEFFQNHKNRTLYLHFKDMDSKENKGDVEVGEGFIDFEKILEIAGESYVEWVVVEQEQFKIPPMESVEISLKNIRKMF